jgi:hypothetical protein
MAKSEDRVQQESEAIMDKPSDLEFEKADRAVMRAAATIEKAITALLATTQSLDAVAQTYVVERLMAELISRNPKALDFLNTIGFSGAPGKATMRLANALMDWRDGWGDR